jgi:hypothetical protein
MDRPKIFIIPLTICVISFLLRMVLISQGPYNVDCLNLVIQAEKTLATYRLGNMPGPGYPLTVISAALFISILKIFHFSDPVLIVNFMSVVYSSLAVGLFYLLAQELFDRKVAIFSSIMLSVCPIFLGISVYGISQPLNMFTLIAGFYFLVVYKKNRLMRNLILAVLFFGLAGANRLHEMLFMFFPASYLLLCRFPQLDKAKSIKENMPTGKLFVVFWMQVVLIALFFHLPYVLQDNRAYWQQLTSWFDMGLYNKFILAVSPRIFSGVEYMRATLTVGGMAVFLGGMALLFRRDKKMFMLMVLWIIFAYIFYSNSYMSVTSRYFVILLPPVLLTQGYMFAVLTGKNKILKIVTTVMFIAIIGVLWVKIYPVLMIRHQNSYLPEFTRWVEGKTEPNARIITSDDGLFFSYYTNLTQVSRPLKQARITGWELEQCKERIDVLLEDDIPVYIYSVSLYAYDSGSYFTNFLKDRYQLTWVGVHLYEDWHRGDMISSIFPNHLYKIEKKSIMNGNS